MIRTNYQEKDGRYVHMGMTIECKRCGKEWTPRPAKGRTGPTDSSLDREARDHLNTCNA